MGMIPIKLLVAYTLLKEVDSEGAKVVPHFIRLMAHNGVRYQMR